jgi:hypothetical protein
MAYLSNYCLEWANASETEKQQLKSYIAARMQYKNYQAEHSNVQMVPAKSFSITTDYMEILEGDWTTEHEDMRKLSMLFPTTHFVLLREGVDASSLDMTKTHYLNGSYQVCPGAIVFPEFDSSKLEPIPANQ